MAYVPNASSRFLFAILKQCDLRHIDWDEVCQDIHLEKPITNGHAARMRYSRLRTLIQGPTKKSTTRATNQKTTNGRVAKPKKAAPAKASDARAAQMDTQMATPVEPNRYQTRMPLPGITIKREPGTMPTPAPDHVHRFMTPCSDEMFPQTPHLDFGSRMQTPEVANHGLFGFGEDMEECGHPEEFKQSHEMINGFYNAHMPFMTNDTPWTADNRSHSGSIDGGCFHMTGAHPLAGPRADPLFASTPLMHLQPGQYPRIKTENLD